MKKLTEIQMEAIVGGDGNACGRSVLMSMMLGGIIAGGVGAVISGLTAAGGRACLGLY